MTTTKTKTDGAAMLLTLHHVRNCDISHLGGYWSPPAESGRKRVVPVKSLAEASAVFCAWRDRNGLGAGNIAREAGNVTQGGKQIARVSYNGRVWEPGEWPTKEIILSAEGSK